jgi:hypothetical protein
MDTKTDLLRSNIDLIRWMTDKCMLIESFYVPPTDMFYALRDFQQSLERELQE